MILQYNRTAINLDINFNYFGRMDASFIEQKTLKAFGLDAHDFEIIVFGSGLIHKTWKLTGKQQTYILQKINKDVFKTPEYIADNLQKLHFYLLKTAPDYIFPAPLPAANGSFLVRNDNSEYFRLMPFVPKSHTINLADNPSQAYEAAKAFGKFTRLLKDFDPQQLKATISDFHNLELRYQEFEIACKSASETRKEIAQTEIKTIIDQSGIVGVFNQITTKKLLPLRVMHHDTKINNVLFDEAGKGLCVVDLDTVMPGYFLSDVGDMLRTYLSPANEEESDFSKIEIRAAYYQAVYQGYMSEMEVILNPAEKQYFFYAGKMMVYMQAIRFLTDYLNNDIYYATTYHDQNLIRAKNQLDLLQKLVTFEANNPTI